MYVCLESLKPEMRAESARQTKAKKAMLMEAADESVKTLSAPSRMRFVSGTAADSADIRRYAVTCRGIVEAAKQARLKNSRVKRLKNSSNGRKMRMK
jgi:hypothetical protein